MRASRSKRSTSTTRFYSTLRSSELSNILKHAATCPPPFSCVTRPVKLFLLVPYFWKSSLRYLCVPLRLRGYCFYSISNRRDAKERREIRRVHIRAPPVFLIRVTIFASCQSCVIHLAGPSEISAFRLRIAVIFDVFTASRMASRQLRRRRRCFRTKRSITFVTSSFRLASRRSG